ncbi:MAG: hypothetical protein FWB86_02705 [Treponema sp.]|nr:hypothetical protein [Treponema sp.]MCL2251775.1 hypothetical protein [Treponema sp.]
MTDYIRQHSTYVQFPINYSWVILSPIEERIKAKIEQVGIPLRDWEISINYGIKTGCNEAFIINSEKRNELIEKDAKSAEIIRPILRGRDIARYQVNFADLYLINTHNGIPLKNIPPIDIEKYPAIKEHLVKYWIKIKNRDDQGITPFNLRSCAYMDDFSKLKIVWKRVGSILRFCYDDKKYFALDSTCFAIGSHLKYLLAYLNSAIGHYLLQDAPKTGTGDLLISVQALEPILIPIISEKDEQIIKTLTDNILSFNNINKKEIENEINMQIFKLLDLDKIEIEYILKYIKIDNNEYFIRLLY